MTSAIMLQDLTPRKDPKGGSPKTPSGGIKKSAFAEQTPYPPCMAEQPKRWHDGIQFRDVLYAVSIITVALLFIFQRQSDVHDIANKVTALDDVQKQLSLTIKAQQTLIDSNAMSNQLLIAGNIERDKRIAEAQAQLTLLVPDVREIRTKLNFVADMLDQRSKQKP